MLIRVTRTGGFAGITRRREIDTADLDPHAAEVLRRLAETAMSGGGAAAAAPDAFAYQVDIDGTTYLVSGDDPVWRALLERVGVQ